MPHVPKNSAEALFVQLDENFERLYPNKAFWKRISRIDEELIPGAIFVSPDGSKNARDLRHPDLASWPRLSGEPTITIRVQSPETALDVAAALKEIFIGTGVRFVPEMVEEDGQRHYQISSNIDKRQWEKLCVFCSYRYNRELQDPQERKRAWEESEARIRLYTKGTEHENWHAVEGLPAFCTLMGLHGNLRPKEGLAPDWRRKESELNEQHPSGVPHIFRGVVVHVDMRKSGDIVTSQYTYNISRAAWDKATGSKPYWMLLLDTLGGNPFEKGMPPAERAANAMGLAMGITGVGFSGSILTNMAGPAATLAVATAFLGFTYADHRLHFFNRMAGKLKLEKQKQPELVMQQVLSQAIEQAVSQEIHNAYTRGGVEHVEISPDDIHEAVRRRLLAGGMKPSSSLAEAMLSAASRQRQ